MKFLKNIQDAIGTCIFLEEVTVEVAADKVSVSIVLGDKMAIDDASSVMELSGKLTKIAEEDGYELPDTPFHFCYDHKVGIVFRMEFFNKEE